MVTKYPPLSGAGGGRPQPLDLVEKIAISENWPYARESPNEITMVVAVQMCDLQIAFTWMPDIEALHLACAFDLKVPEHRLEEIRKLILLINEHLWIGHFDLWAKDGLVMFRHALILSGGIDVTEEQCISLLRHATEGCGGYYPAFNFVLWSNKSAQEAIDAAMFDTKGSC